MGPIDPLVKVQVLDEYTVDRTLRCSVHVLPDIEYNLVLLRFRWRPTLSLPQVALLRPFYGCMVSMRVLYKYRETLPRMYAAIMCVCWHVCRCVGVLVCV